MWLSLRCVSYMFAEQLDTQNAFWVGQRVEWNTLFGHECCQGTERPERPGIGSCMRCLRIFLFLGRKFSATSWELVLRYLVTVIMFQPKSSFGGRFPFRRADFFFGWFNDGTEWLLFLKVAIYILFWLRHIETSMTVGFSKLFMWHRVGGRSGVPLRILSAFMTWWSFRSSALRGEGIFMVRFFYFLWQEMGLVTNGLFNFSKPTDQYLYLYLETKNKRVASWFFPADKRKL